MKSTSTPRIQRTDSSLFSISHTLQCDIPGDMATHLIITLHITGKEVKIHANQAMLSSLNPTATSGKIAKASDLQVNSASRCLGQDSSSEKDKDA